MEKNQYLLSSVDNALQIIDLLTDKDNLGGAEISKALGLGRATAFRLLYTLEQRGFVSKSVDAKYRLGIKMARIGTLVVERQDMVQICKPVMRELRDSMNETVHLSILTASGKMVFLYKENPKAGSMQMTSRIGAEKEAYVTATGKVLLAALPPDELREIVSAYHFVKMTETTFTNADALLEEIAHIRQCGHGEDNEESELGLTCFAAPIWNLEGKCPAALSVSGPTVRMNARKDEFITTVKAAAAKISASMGHSA